MQNQEISHNKNHSELIAHGWDFDGFKYSHEFLNYPNEININEAYEEHHGFIFYINNQENLTLQ